LDRSKVWDANFGNGLLELVGTPLFFFPDGKKIITMPVLNGNVRGWDIESGKELYMLEGTFRSFSPVAKRIAMVREGKFHIYDAESGKEVSNVNEIVFSRSFFPGGKKIVVLTADGIDQIIDVESGKVLQILEGEFMAAFPDGKKIIERRFDRQPFRILILE
jgi:WD40 repeat protein